MQEISNLRVIFAGTPTFAGAYLAALLSSRHRVAAVYTQPDRPAGRGNKLSASPVKQQALDHGLPVFQPKSLRDTDAQHRLAELQADVMVVVAYGLILPQAVLNIPRHGCLNVHASLLPRWRGAAPVQRAIEAGDRETGITIMQMDAGLDTGPMLASAHCAIENTDTAGSLLERLAELGKDPLLSVLDQLPQGTLRPSPQDQSGASYASKVDKAEAHIDWRQSASTIDRKVRAFHPAPVAYTQLGEQRIKIHRAIPLSPTAETETETTDAETKTINPGTITAVDDTSLTVSCGSGSLQLTELQLPGKRRMAIEEILRGNKTLFVPGQQLR